jgi:hypothetical protein
LWIQDAVREGLIQLIQIPTVWNLSDIGTEALGIQRIRLLLHELNVATGDGFFELEYQAQAERHVGGRQMSKLVKQIARVLILMGLESSAPRPMAMVTDSMLDDDSFHGGVFQCSKEPNSVDQGGAFPSNTMLYFHLDGGRLFVRFSLQDVSNGKRRIHQLRTLIRSDGHSRFCV